MAEETFQPRKLFNLDDANAMLPLVSRVVRDIVKTFTELEEVAAAEDGVASRADELERQLEELGRELAALGCMLKDPRVGLVDFPARIAGRYVLLCWKLGEDRVSFWHELDSGFAGRKPVRGVFV